MARKNIERYIQAWRLRKEGKKLHEIGQIMGISKERARILSNHIELKIKYKKPVDKKIKQLIDIVK